MKQSAPAAVRNREPIREVLARHLPPTGRVLTIAEGTGEHVVYLARSFPALTWLPTDRDVAALASITAWRAEAALDNILPAAQLDVTAAAWPVEHADAITCINMVHIAPWEAAVGLFSGAAQRLSRDALLYLYGPFRFDGAFTSPSNEAFDASLRARDARWGVRDVRDVERAATSFALRDIIAMPANNHSLVFRRL